MKKISLFILSISLVLLCSCAAQKPADSGNSATTAIPSATHSPTQSSESAEASSTSPAPESASPAASSQTNAWPDEFKGNLPTPVCKITDIMRYDEKSMSGKLTIVSFSGMSKADAEKYVEALKSMGFSGGITLSDDSKIAFSGVGKDQAAQNGVNFMYSVSDQTGTISY